MANNNKLNFYIGDESKLKVSNLYEEELNENTLFSDMFKHVLGEINLVLPEICSNTRFLRDTTSNEMVLSVEKTANNIFGFIGDRGSGKSSSMMSVAVSLKNCDGFKNKMSGRYANIEKYRFLVMETIDPSFFDNKVNILDIVIGKMYREFKKNISNQVNQTLRNELFDCFQVVKRCIANNMGMSDVSEDDDIESLEYLSSGVELQCTMQKLINTYLKYYERDVFVIPIDDMDMHTECGYKMLEQVRKYLIQQNVIVLMALKLDQMERVIQLGIANQYKTLKDWGLTKPENLIERASRYMAKLLPHSHRFFMPTYDDIVDSKLELLIQDNNGEKIHNGEKWSLDKEFPTGTAKYVVTRAIYWKTRYLFYHAKGKVSPIVPDNLRELRYLVGLLYDMPSYKKDGTTEYNKELFKEYFLASWMSTNLDESGKRIVDALFEITDASIINKTVIQFLYQKYEEYLTKKELTKSDREFAEIANIVNNQNTSYNISIGDVFAIVIHLKNRLVNTFDKNLLFAIETFYSMNLYEYYDYRTEHRYALQEDDIDYTIRRHSLMDGISKYHQLVGGNFINSKYFRLLTPDMGATYTDEDNWRAIRKISMSRIGRIVEDISNKEKNKGLTDKYISWLHSLELLALFVSRKKYNTKKAGYDASYRQESEVYYYNFDFEEKRETAVQSYHPSQTLYFDVASFFFNITDIQLAYDKINKGLYPLADKINDSLLNKLRVQTVNRYPQIEGYETVSQSSAEKEKTFIKSDIRKAGVYLFYDVQEIHRWFLSWCSIRNAEILEAFTSHISTYGMRSDVKLYNYLEHASKFFIKTYDNTGEDAYNIKYDYITGLGDVFDEKYLLEFEKFVSLRGLEAEGGSAETLEELCNEILRGGKSRYSIAQNIMNSESPLLKDVNRKDLIDKLEIFRRKNGIRTWGKKVFFDCFTELFDDILKEKGKKKKKIING